MESTQKANARSCSKPIFLQALAPRYGHFVEELGIEFWSDPCSAINILTSLALLTNVRKIALPSPEHVYWRLENGSLTATGGSGFPAEFASPEFVETALRRVMQHAETVVLPRDGLMDTIPFVRGAGLTKLEMAVSSGDLPTLLSTIVDCPNLHTLHIAGRRDDNHTFRHAAYLPSLSHPTLRRLEISDASGGEGVYDFVQQLKIFWGLGEAKPPEPPFFRLPRLQQLEVLGWWKATAPLVYAILPAAFPALQSCTWSLDRALLPSERKAFPAEAVTAITHVRAQQVVRAAPLQFTLEWTASSEPEAVATLRTALGEADIPIGVGQGGVVVEFAKPDLEFNYGPPDPPALILTPKLCLTDDSKVADLGEDISASLERIRDLKDQAVVVGDRVQISRIAQALQEGEWLSLAALPKSSDSI
ncbi:hypothetical protein RHOSPDRAFT_27943 [Rhodotorula sp. JG-1b]|nr:hypothetical protein RHOSPDRAFT_27943 [Rhodotorula sp. JG-1b]